MPTSVAEWHQRYSHQAQWTHGLASYVFQQARIAPEYSILEVGCGTGAILDEILQPSYPHYFGLDINSDFLTFAAQNHQHSKLILGDAHKLPFANDSLDVCVCHYLLLWVTSPLATLMEMCRVTRSHGVVLALAEPDYENRIDYPQELSILSKWQKESLLDQGADPLLGRKLRSLFSRCGLTDVKAGLLGGEWKMPESNEHDSEWAVLRSDLASDPNKLAVLENLADIDSKAWDNGERILYVPTFYAWGRVP